MICWSCPRKDPAKIVAVWQQIVQEKVQFRPLNDLRSSSWMVRCLPTRTAFTIKMFVSSLHLLKLISWIYYNDRNLCGVLRCQSFFFIKKIKNAIPKSLRTTSTVSKNCFGTFPMEHFINISFRNYWNHITSLTINFCVIF
jgi:hypothetical protein